jgi:hypothetical protein
MSSPKKTKLHPPSYIQPTRLVCKSRHAQVLNYKGGARLPSGAIFGLLFKGRMQLFRSQDCPFQERTNIALPKKHNSVRPTYDSADNEKLVSALCIDVIHSCLLAKEKGKEN